MDKKLQDYVWSVLPKKFKEEVKKIYSSWTNPMAVGFESHIITCEYIFGKHNLTSDAEGEEMLTVPRKDIIELYQEVQKTISQCKGTELAIQAIGVKNVIWSFFGSKCLPDEAQPKQKDCDNPLADKEGCRWRNDGKCAFDSACYFDPLNPQEPQSAEPKLDRGQKYKIIGGKEAKGLIGQIVTLTFFVPEENAWAAMLPDMSLIYLTESDLEPYTEPKEVTKMKPIEHKVRVYIATKEEDEEFRMLLHNNGFKWSTSTLLIDLSCWTSDYEDSKIHCIYPDKTVTCYGDKTLNTITFSEFKKQYFENVNLSQETSNCDKQFDNILKDNFSKELRLNIAAMAMQGLLSNPNTNANLSEIVADALNCADALIAESEKEGE